jgi:threonine dehydrogenase-like Zn-dependent dehydrogenase
VHRLRRPRGPPPHGLVHGYERVKQAARLATERPHALREAIMGCRSGGTVAIMGVYGGFMDKFPSARS